MTWHMSDKEFEAVISLSEEKRYAYLIKRICDWEEVWGLWKDGWVLGGDDAGTEAMPIWPHPRFAVACASGPWEGAEARLIPLSDWLNTWIPGLEQDNRLIAAFPTAAGKAIVVRAEAMSQHLGEELELYE